MTFWRAMWIIPVGTITLTAVVCFWTLAGIWGAIWLTIEVLRGKTKLA
jgi:hypothetical protein